MGQLESYGMLNIPLTETLATRFNFARSEIEMVL